MKLLIISSSQGTPSNSARIGGYISNLAADVGFSLDSKVDLVTLNLPFWDGSQDRHSILNWPELEVSLKEADALVLITPEWNGTASPMLKNFLMMCPENITSHKPAMLVSVVNGVNGAYPVAELRMNAFKNNKILPIPEHVIVRDVEEFVDAPKNKENRTLQRFLYSLDMLKHYAIALKPVQQAYQNYNEEFDYGM